MKIGDAFTVQKTVTEDMTAAALGSGGLPVFGTPYLIAMVENAAFTPSDSLRLRFNPDTPSTEPKFPAFSQLARGKNAPLLAKSQQNANVGNSHV